MPASGWASKCLGMGKTTAKSCVAPSHPAPRTLKVLPLGTGGFSLPKFPRARLLSPLWFSCQLCGVGALLLARSPRRLGNGCGLLFPRWLLSFLLGTPPGARGGQREGARGTSDGHSASAPFSAFLCRGEVDGNLLRMRPQKKKKRGKSAKSSQLHTLRAQGARRRGAGSPAPAPFATGFQHSLVLRLWCPTALPCCRDVFAGEGHGERWGARGEVGGTGSRAETQGNPAAGSKPRCHQRAGACCLPGEGTSGTKRCQRFAGSPGEGFGEDLQELLPGQGGQDDSAQAPLVGPLSRGFVVLSAAPT